MALSQDKNGGNERKDVNPAYPEDEDDESVRKTGTVSSFPDRSEADTNGEEGDIHSSRSPVWLSRILKFWKRKPKPVIKTSSLPPTPLPKEFYKGAEYGAPEPVGASSLHTPTSAEEYNNKGEEIGSPTTNPQVVEDEVDFDENDIDDINEDDCGGGGGGVLGVLVGAAWSCDTPTSAEEYNKWKEIWSSTKNSEVFKYIKDGDCCLKICYFARIKRYVFERKPPTGNKPCQVLVYARI